MPAHRAIERAAKPLTLARLAKLIDQEHHAVRQEFKKTARHAEAAGRLLIEAKERVLHGGWLKWVQKNTDVSPRTASAYMKIAHKFSELDDEKRQHAADLSQRRFLEELMQPPTPEASNMTVEAVPQEERTVTFQIEAVPQEERTVTFQTKAVPQEERTVTFQTKAVPQEERTVTAPGWQKVSTLHDKPSCLPPAREEPRFTPAAVLEKVEDSCLGMSEANGLAALQLIRRGGAGWLAQLAKIDDTIDLEAFSEIFADAAVLAQRQEASEPVAREIAQA